MYRAIAKLHSIAALTQSKQHTTPKEDGESHDAFELRTWREKGHFDGNDTMFIPAMAFKQAADAAAKRLAIPDPDNKRSTLTKFFVSDVICEANVSIGIKKNDVSPVTISANVDGVRGSGKRVPRTFPQVEDWHGTAVFLVMEEKITQKIFERVLTTAGQSIGVGQFRPENGGLNGRFVIESIKFERNL
jgi:hypothetical protein